MNERAKLAHQIGKSRKPTASMLRPCPRRRSSRAGGRVEPRPSVAASALRSVFRELISGSRALERSLRVAYLGPAYTYSHLAAIHRFGQSVELVPVGSIRRRLRRSQPRAGAVWPGAAGELHRRPRRRHAGHVHAAARCGSAAKCNCGFTITCWAAVRGPTCKRSTAGRRRCRSAATGWLEAPAARRARSK